MYEGLPLIDKTSEDLITTDLFTDHPSTVSCVLITNSLTYLPV